AKGPRAPESRVFTGPGIGAVAKMRRTRTLRSGRSRVGDRGRLGTAQERQASRRDTGEIEGDQERVVEPGLDHAALAVPPAGGEERGGEGANLHSTTRQATDHRDVLHDGNIGEPAGRLK